MTSFSPKDPNDLDDFTLNWAPYELATDEAILSVSVEVREGSVTVVGSSISTTFTTVRLEDGVEGEMIYVIVTITTSLGRRLNEDMRFQIRSSKYNT